MNSENSVCGLNQRKPDGVFVSVVMVIGGLILAMFLFLLWLCISAFEWLKRRLLKTEREYAERESARDRFVIEYIFS